MPVKLIKGELVRPFATEDHGGWGVVTGTVALAMPGEMRQFYESDGEFGRLRKKFGGDSARAEAEFFARYVRSWDVEDDGGKAAAVTPENFALLPAPVFAQFRDIVEGFTASRTLGNSPPSSGS